MNPKPVSIRRAGPQDADEVVRLVNELAEQSGEVSSISPQYVLQYLSENEHQVLLAERSGRILGLLSYSVQPDLYHAGPVGLIELLVVHLAERGKGVGSSLVGEIIRRAKAQGWVELSVSTMPENLQAIDFYRNLGFKDQAVLLEQHFK